MKMIKKFCAYEEILKLKIYLLLIDFFTMFLTFIASLSIIGIFNKEKTWNFIKAHKAVKQPKNTFFYVDQGQTGHVVDMDNHKSYQIADFVSNKSHSLSINFELVFFIIVISLLFFMLILKIRFTIKTYYLSKDEKNQS